jgi:hypothetical protein
MHRRPLADLVTGCRGIMVGITCDWDPAELSVEVQLLDDAVADGELLLGWAPLAHK